jgi:hypothetical protein
MDFSRTAVRPAHRSERTQWHRTKRRLARHRKIAAFFQETLTLKLGGGILVGVYGVFGLFATVLSVTGIAFGVPGAAAVLLVGLVCFVLAAFGVWVYRSA